MAELPAGKTVFKVMLTEPGRQASWLFMMFMAFVYAQAGIALLILGIQFRHTMLEHDIIFKIYGKLQINHNSFQKWTVGFPLISGLLVLKSSLLIFLTGILAREVRVSRRFVSRMAKGCCLFEILQVILLSTGAAVFPVLVKPFHGVYGQYFARAVVLGYMKHAAITGYINDVQYNYQCCGVTDYKDWFIVDWMDKEWLKNRYPTVQYFRNHHYARGPKVGKYPTWREMSLMKNYGQTDATKLRYLEDRLRGKTDDSLIDEYVRTTSFSEVPHSCCNPDSRFTWCVRQYVVFDAFGYTFADNATIYLTGCPEQLERYIDGHVWVLTALVVSVVVLRLFSFLLLRLLQTSTANALASGDPLSTAYGWLLHRKSKSAPEARADKLKSYGVEDNTVLAAETDGILTTTDGRGDGTDDDGSDNESTDDTTTTAKTTDGETTDATTSTGSEVTSVDTTTDVTTSDGSEVTSHTDGTATSDVTSDTATSDVINDTTSEG